ncbi:MAG: TraB/GumN family protein [Bacteroidia bacterium]|nr:TraB/GumN family protein [Bacteroidia bacterium]
MKRLLYILILLPFLTFSQSQKKYPTLLWKITGKDLKKPSYLYGTMHVSSRVAYHLSEQFFEALKSVDVVGLETNPGDWLVNMEKTGELDQANQIVSNNNYRKDFYRSTFMSSFPDKRVLQGILSYDPDIINGLLYRHNRSKENFEENTYIDLFIYQSASKLGKQLISLEDFAASEIKARLSALPDNELNEEENSENSNNYYYNGQKIEDAYRDGNLDVLDSLSKKTSSKNTQKYLINDRNVFFVNTIDSVLKTKSLFSGVGAAHLPGDEGVIELLRKKGYTVEPVFPKNSKKSDAIRDELDALVKPVTFQKQFVNDSSMAMNLPGKLTQIVNFETIKYYIYADMINGSFYTVARLKYFGPLFNVSTAQMMQKVDSLLFENIPGKITLKKEITSNNGLKGIEVVNKTRRGDEQHYQIYFSDLEMIMFKLGGKQTYATGSEAKQFFNSIQFLPKGQTIVDFTPKTKGFAVKVPANYSYTKVSGSSSKGLIEDLYAYNTIQKQFYGVKQAVYNDFEYLEEDTFELNLFSKNILKNYNFSEKITREIVREQNLPCVKFSAKNKMGSNFYGKLFIKGVHYYLVYFISEKESSFNNDFFSSFKLTDFEFINPIKTVTDNDYHFKVKDEVTVNASSKFNEAYAKEYEIAKVKKEKKTPNDYDYHSSNKAYYSPSSNEYVNITYEKYNDYDYRNISEIEQSISTSIKNTTGLLITNKVTGTKDGIYSYKCTLKDTATSRVMDVKIYFKNGIMQEIIAPYDSVIGLKGWTKDFMDSFTPKDTVIGKNIFENKFTALLNDLCSTDTVVRQRANSSLLNSISMNKVYIDEFIKFIGSKNLSLVSEDSRAQLFVNGGTMASNKIIEPYKNLYKQYTDSFYLQLCMLKGLAYLKTPASFATFNNLILNETPLVGEVTIVSDVFAVLHDSLELCKNFFPGMLVLTKYDEYKDAVYTLMSELVNKKIISSAAYLAQKDNILADANLALKRYNPSSSKSNSEYSEYDYLDKSIKELAENIQQSLDGFTNNNLFKGSAYLKGLETFNRSPLVNYAIILSPFYKTDEKTKQFFTKLSKLKTQSIAMPVAINLLKSNIVINDTLTNFYSKNKITRAYFYTELEKEKLTEKFDKKYLTQMSLIESVLTAQTQLSNIYSYDKDKGKKDSLLFIKELDAKNKYQKGKIYVYRIIKSKADDERWSVAFVPDSKTGISSNVQVINSGYYIDKTKTEEENFNEILDYFNLTYRKRAITASSSY